MLSHQVKTPEKMLAALESWFAQYRSCIVAFSGGVDSTLLAFASKRALGDKAVAVLSRSPAFSQMEHSNAALIAEQIGINLYEVSQNDLGTPQYVENSVSRCYFCRSNLALAIAPLAEELDIEVRVDGTHLDDMKSPRPGIKALRESGFRAPFVELGFVKDDVRAISKFAGLPNADRPSEACLSSRIAFGERINEELLIRIERAEKIVRKLTGASIVRVRTISTKAIVEVDKNSIRLAEEKKSEISSGLRALGYNEIEISNEGYVSGRMLDLFIKSER